jgi:adenosylcobinamide-GDP ribazoletransferase
LALKFAALGHLAGGQQWRVIAAAPAVGRLAIVLAVAVFPYARETGTGAKFALETRWQHATLAVLLAMALCFWLLGWSGTVLVGAGIVVALLAGAYGTRRLGGLTGDVYGAINELSEVAALLIGSITLAAAW